MLKWSASAQKLNQEVTLSPQTANPICTPRFAEKKRRKRRATIANKENIAILTSTPMGQRARNSPLVMAPLADILNVTPESEGNRAPERRRLSVNAVSNRNAGATRRHSTVGFVIPTIPQYATTLPKYEEEYSPSTELPTGQQLALRGLLPDAFMGNPRYFTTPQHPEEQKVKKVTSFPGKRKLEQDFVTIAREQEVMPENSSLNHTEVTSNKMDDQTLDNLIDAILDSACKEEKKKKRRKSFNLRRRTLLKNQVEQYQDTILSPSYTAGDDPCNDVSFLNSESLSCLSVKTLKATTPQPTASQPATPLITVPFNKQLLAQLPTPPVRKLRDSFSLETPVRSKLKRRSESTARSNSNAKKYKADSSNYFEIGVALPSIYV